MRTKTKVILTTIAVALPAFLLGAGTPLGAPLSLHISNGMSATGLVIIDLTFHTTLMAAAALIAWGLVQAPRKRAFVASSEEGAPA